MASQAQITANRRNALKSTGPRTEAGKEISSRNATTHGLTAKNLLIPGEDPQAFEVMRNRLLEELEPNSTLEMTLVEKMVCDLWRLSRVPAFEAALLASTAGQLPPSSPMMERLRQRRRADPAVDQDEARRHNEIGRILKMLFSKDDLLSKLARHEAHLARQIRTSWDLLQRHREPHRNGGATPDQKSALGLTCRAG